MAFLIGIFSYRTGIDNEDVRGIGEISLYIPFLLKHPRNRGGFRVIELTAKSVKRDFFHTRLQR